MQEARCIKPAKVAIVGMGHVGSTVSYTLMIDGVVSELALIDLNKNKAEGEALDLRHGIQFTKSAKIWAGDSFELVHDAEIVVITAGVAQVSGESRLDLLNKNISVFKNIIPKIVDNNKDCILLIVTNPLDVLTYVALKLSGFPSCRVIGTGTVLDTARLRYLLGKYFKINPKDITAYILGEHGDSEFPWWSGANVAGVSLKNLENYSDVVVERITQEVKNTVYEVIEKKGATYYAIALVITKIVRAILMNQSRVFTVSNLVDKVCLSVPTVIHRGGICEKLKLSLNENEQILFTKSTEKIRKAIEKVGKFF